MSTLFLSNISWDACGSHGKHHHVHAWWFQMFDQVYNQFLFLFFLSPITTLTCFNFKFHDCIELLLFQFLIQFNSSWFSLIVLSISYWIARIVTILNFCFNSHIKKTNTIQGFHNINTMNMERHATCTFACPIGG
jgi:hypothetical protein